MGEVRVEILQGMRLDLIDSPERVRVLPRKEDVGVDVIAVLPNPARCHVSQRRRPRRGAQILPARALAATTAGELR